MSARAFEAQSQGGAGDVAKVKRDGRGRRWSREDCDRLVELYQSGLTPLQISERFGVSPYAIKSKLRDWRIPCQHRLPRRDDLAELISQGLTIKQASVRLGMRYGTAKGIWHRIRTALGEQAR